MFRQVYKTTLKNLFRTGLFWLVVAVIVVVQFYDVFSPSYGVTKIHPTTGAYIMVSDTDPNYRMTFETYMKSTSNCPSAVMRYAVPVVAILAVVLILNRDYGDNFYEIEKGAGMRPSAYLLGRFAAILTVVFSFAFIITLVRFHSYFALRSPIREMGTVFYITDSTVRLLRHVVFRLFPPVVLYVGMTFFFGCISRSGIVASLCSLAYMVVYMLQSNVLRWVTPELYNDYFSPVPDKLEMYLYQYDSYDFEYLVRYFNTSLEKAALCVLFLVGVGAFLMLISYIATRRRNR